MGSKYFIGENPPFGAQIYYSLAKKANKASVKILDYTGKTMREVPADILNEATAEARSLG